MSDVDANPSLWRSVREILFREWDPILVNSNENLTDEYDYLVPAFVKLIGDGASASQLEEALERAEKNDLLTDHPDPVARNRAAMLLYALKVTGA